MEAGIIGTGKWGRAIGTILERNGHKVFFVSRYDFEKLELLSVDIFFIALRTEAIFPFLQQYSKALKGSVCMLSKGFYTYDAPFFSDYFSDISIPYAILSGPNFADEAFAGVPTITTVASKNNELLEMLKNALHSENFEVETSDSVKCIEIYAIFKNIISIQSGYMEKLSLPFNSKSKIITKLVQEMINFCQIIEEPKDSFFKAAGIGDLFLTCTSFSSRNFQYGYNFNSESLADEKENEITVEGTRSLLLIPYLEKKYSFTFTYYKYLHKFFIEKQAGYGKKILE